MTRISAPGKFKKIYVEITNNCNLACDFCPGTSRKPEFMGAGLFEKILSEIKGRTQYLYFHVMGEPLLHPLLGRFLDLCHEYGMRVNITTNGTLIDRSGYIALKPALRQVNFSLHSMPYGANGENADRYIDRVFEFIDTPKQGRGPLICLRLWNHGAAGADAEGGNEYILRRLRQKFPDCVLIEDKTTPVNGIKLRENVFLNQSERFDWPDLENDISGVAGYCNCLRYQAAVLVDGTVVPCCLDREGTINLGNIRTEHFGEIISGARAKNIYNGFTRKEAVEPLCGKCGFRLRFGKVK